MNCSGIVACLLEAMAAGTPASKPTTGRRLLYASLRFSPHSGTLDLDPDSETLTEVIEVSMRARTTSVFSHFSFQGFLVLVQAKQANKVEK